MYNEEGELNSGKATKEEILRECQVSEKELLDMLNGHDRYDLLIIGSEFTGGYQFFGLKFISELCD